MSLPFQIPETPAQIKQALAVVEEELERRHQDSRVQHESIYLMQNFREFVKAAWNELEPLTVFRSNWHIDAICEHLQAISESKLRRLQIWVPPVSMKSRLVSVLWPAWEWTHSPSLRYWTASYDISLSKEMTMYSRNLILEPWYQERWGHMFSFVKTDESYLINDKAGSRLSTSPQSKGTGKHGHRIMFDDPLNAQDANAVTKAVLESTNEWYTGTTSSRGLENYAEIIVMQRLHESDMAAHALNFGDWEVLCLPEVYEKHHPFAWRHDPRKEGDLLWPDKRPAKEHDLLVARLGKRHAAGQLQQRPAAREGTILSRSDWRYYPKQFLDSAESGDTSKLPAFTSIVIAWDTSIKDLHHSDYVAGGIWGVKGANRYLLRTHHQRQSFSGTKRAMLELRQWTLDRWPQLPLRTLIEKQSNGVEIIKQLKAEVPGIIDVVVSVDKQTRAEAAEPDFNSHNVYVPGAQKPDGTDYDPSQTPSWVQDLIEECSSFPLAKNDDLVDMTTLALNWVRNRRNSPVRTASALHTAQRNRRREAHLAYRWR